MKEYELTEKGFLKVIGIECRTQNSEGRGMIDIPVLWQRFHEEQVFSKIPNRASEQVVALYHDYEGNYTNPYSLIIGAFVTSLDEIPEGFKGKELRSSRYAQFACKGEMPQSLIEGWHKVWSLEEQLDRRYEGDLEVYSGIPDEVELFIGVK